MEPVPKEVLVKVGAGLGLAAPPLFVLGGVAATGGLAAVSGVTLALFGPLAVFGFLLGIAWSDT